MAGRGLGVNEAKVPRAFQFAVLVFILATGFLPNLVQAVVFGVEGVGGAFAAAFVAALCLDLLRIAPVVVLSRHPAGVLHPIILIVVIWPILINLPDLISDFFGFSGLLAGEPLSPPHFMALRWHSDEQAWTNILTYNSLQIVALLSIYAGFGFASGYRAKKVDWFDITDTIKLRRVLIGIILATFAAVALFIQSQGGLIEHIAELSFGRFRALSGLGPLIAIFDMSFVALTIWICYRPQDARAWQFIVLLPLVAAQQFVVNGSRSGLLIVFITVGIGWMLRTNRIPWRLAFLLLPVAFLSLGALNIVRTAGTQQKSAAEAIEDSRFIDVIERSRVELEQRRSLAGSVPVAIDGMRTTGPMFGYTYLGAIFALVPRGLWEDKPRGPGSIYAQTFLGESREGQAVPVSDVSEAFWNFHLFGVTIIFALFGMTLKLLYTILFANRRNGIITAISALFVTQAGPGTEQLVALQQTALVIVFVLLIVAMAFPKNAQRSATSA